MKIKENIIEDWGVKYEYTSKYNLGETCVSSLSISQLCELAGIDEKTVMKTLADRVMDYGDLEGRPKLLAEIAGLYKTIQPEDIFTATGSSGGNLLTFASLVEPGDHVITIIPSYPQLTAFPECFGADVTYLKLKKEDDYLPNLAELRSFIRKDTKLIVINNPHNPTGKLIPNSYLEKIVDIAREAGCYLLSDETYRYLNQDGSYTESAADLYDKAVSVAGMTKVFSMAGLRLGWAATRDPWLKKQLKNFREYFTISSSIPSEYFAELVLEHKEVVLARNKRLIRDNLEVVRGWIAQEPHFTMLEPDGATMTMLYYDYEVDSMKVCRELYEQEKVFIYPGSMFDLPGNSIRLGFACGNQELKDGLAAVSRYFARAGFPLKK